MNFSICRHSLRLALSDFCFLVTRPSAISANRFSARFVISELSLNPHRAFQCSNTISAMRKTLHASRTAAPHEVHTKKHKRDESIKTALGPTASVSRKWKCFLARIGSCWVITSPTLCTSTINIIIKAIKLMLYRAARSLANNSPATLCRVRGVLPVRSSNKAKCRFSHITSINYFWSSVKSRQLTFLPINWEFIYRSELTIRALTLCVTSPFYS